MNRGRKAFLMKTNIMLFRIGTAALVVGVICAVTHANSAPAIEYDNQDNSIADDFGVQLARLEARFSSEVSKIRRCRRIH